MASQKQLSELTQKLINKGAEIDRPIVKAALTACDDTKVITNQIKISPIKDEAGQFKRDGAGATLFKSTSFTLEMPVSAAFKDIITQALREARADPSPKRYGDIVIKCNQMNSGKLFDLSNIITSTTQNSSTPSMDTLMQHNKIFAKAAKTFVDTVSPVNTAPASTTRNKLSANRLQLNLTFPSK